MTGASAERGPLSSADADRVHRTAVWIAADGFFAGSGFLAAEGLVVTAAHVVAGRERVVVWHGGRAYPAGEVRAEPAAGDGTRFFPYPDLAVLTVPALRGRPVADLAAYDAQPGTDVAGLGYGSGTPTSGVQPDTLALRVGGRSGAFVRVSGDRVQEGHSGSPLADSAGLVVGVLKGSRSYDSVQGGWFTPVSALRRLLGITPAPPPPTPERPPTDAELVDALEAFPALTGVYGRYDLLVRMGAHLTLPHSFGADERPGRRAHLFCVIDACRHFRDKRVALIAVYTAMEEIAPYDAALERLRELIGRAIGGWGDA